MHIILVCFSTSQSVTESTDSAEKLRSEPEAGISDKEVVSDAKSSDAKSSDKVTESETNNKISSTSENKDEKEVEWDDNDTYLKVYS